MTSATITETGNEATVNDGLAVELMERGWLPDRLIRFGIRQRCMERLREEASLSRKEAFLAQMREGPIAPVPEKANEQHYELPPEFFGEVLGDHRKYSSAYWTPRCVSLDEAEREALEQTVAHADLADGQRVLELGCGWGSLTLFMAERFSRSTIVAVSNSAPQRRYIESAARARGLGNIEVRTADMNTFDPGETFDRIVSVEMFEHMRNYRTLLQRVSRWLRDDGRLFVHIFAHRTLLYPFETHGRSDWMGRHFFTGGIMPSDDIFEYFTDDMAVEERWWWDGTHYQRTADAWLERIDDRRDAVMPILRETYGCDHAARWYRRWRVFFMACAELFGMQGGAQWGVGHYRLRKVRG
jgi:cyclopropane-fatty-acyl-phospholipid synthase